MLYVCWTTLESEDQAKEMATRLIDSGLAACAQIDSPMLSVYGWKGVTETDREVRLTLKTTEQRYDELEAWVLNNHPYETPQWVAVKADKVSPGYLDWARENTAKE